MNRILLVEDEDSIRMALEDDLKLEGYAVTCATDGQLGLSLARENPYDLILLDLMLPKLNGLEICKELRQAGRTEPILMLTARSQELDKVLGLELGADDYVTKPFSPRELLARGKALLRRTQRIQQGVKVVEFGNVQVDFKKYETKKKGRLVYLTALEYSLLHFLIERKEEVVSRDAILDGVWGREVHVYPRTVDLHIAHLRKKIEDDPANPKHILGVRGVGYKFSSSAAPG